MWQKWFNELKEEYSIKNDEEKKKYGAKKNTQPKVPKIHHKIDIFISIVIGISGIFLAAETFGNFYIMMPSVFWWADVIILSVFVWEMILKMISQKESFLDYFRIGWNIFDFIIIIVSIIPFILPSEGSVQAFEALRLLRLFRAFRALRFLEIFSHSEALEHLISTIRRSLPHFSYITLLLGMVIYIYGIIGSFMFGHFDPEHFNNIARSIVTLFGCISGQWVDIMEKNMLNSGFDLFFVPFYFVSFYLIGALIVIQFFTGAIVESMAKASVEINSKNDTNSTKEIILLEKNEIVILEELEKKINELMFQFKNQLGKK